MIVFFYIPCFTCCLILTGTDTKFWILNTVLQHHTYYFQLINFPNFSGWLYWMNFNVKKYVIKTLFQDNWLLIKTILIWILSGISLFNYKKKLVIEFLLNSYIRRLNWHSFIYQKENWGQLFSCNIKKTKIPITFPTNYPPLKEALYIKCFTIQFWMLKILLKYI